MILRITFSLFAAGIDRTNRDALSVDTRVLTRTIVVHAASNLNAFDFRIAVESLFARANRFVVLDSALRIGAAVARVPTNTVNTGSIA